MKEYLMAFHKNLFLFLYFIPFSLISQSDTIRVKTGTVLYGEIKTLRAGVLTMETPFSDDDFTIDFEQVETIKVERKCFVVLNGGARLTGYIRSDSPNTFTFTSEDGTEQTFDMNELAILDQLYERFWRRFSGNIDFSYNLTRANNTQQYILGAGLSYRGPKWISWLKVNSLDSRQDNTENIKRSEINAEAQRLLSRSWYLLGNLSYLSNTEQQLNARYGIRVGAGRFLALNNKLQWGLYSGVNLNLESFSDTTPDRESTELFLGTRLDLFDVKNFDFNTNLNVFRSISEGGRWRVDYSLSAIWDLPYDFYVKTALQFNYDNQAAATGSDFDYIFSTGIGWSFN